MGFYIIEINDKYKQVVLLSAEGDLYCKDVAGLTPYTEPDLEQIRCQAYEEGYAEGSKEDYDEAYLKGYNQGLADAWEAARKIWKYDTTTLKAIFGEGIMRMDWFMNFTAAEAIEKLKAYEQKQEEIKVGDEVEGDEDGQRGVVIDSRFENSQVAVLTGNSKVYSWWSKCAIHKTGRHFSEIAAVMQKMKEEE